MKHQGILKLKDTITMINSAFILAAGKGLRLRPLTDKIPKPMADVNGKPIIGHVLDHVAGHGIENLAVNTHHKAEILHGYLQSQNLKGLHIHHEPELLDTGGGIKKAISQFKHNPFFVLSGDSFWKDGDIPALKTMENLWDENKMDILILLQPLEKVSFGVKSGDYDLDTENRATRALDKSGAYMFTGVRINHPRIFANTPEAPFSYLDLLDRAQENGRLYGLIHDGDWYHISSLADLEAINAMKNAS